MSEYGEIIVSRACFEELVQAFKDAGLADNFRRDYSGPGKHRLWTGDENGSYIVLDDTKQRLGDGDFGADGL